MSTPAQTLAALTVERYGGEVSGVANANATWRQRSGLLVRVRDQRGLQGLGEASPLPGHSPDSLPQCQTEFGALAASDVTIPLTAAGALDIEQLTASSARLTAPAARFGLEAALLDLAARQRRVPAWQLLRPALTDALTDAPSADAPRPIALNAVCSAADPDRALATIETARARGVRCIKLKLGGAFEPERALLQTLRRCYGDALALRADANQAWSAEQARDYLDQLAEFDLEYLEEPAPNPARCWSALAGRGVPLALDESLSRPGARPWVETLLARGAVAALILKPALLGGLIAAAKWAALAARHRAGFVISNLFDGPVALAACAHLALALGAERACGLAPHPGLRAWPACDLAYVHAAHIDAPTSPGFAVTL